MFQTKVVEKIKTFSKVMPFERYCGKIL